MAKAYKLRQKPDLHKLDEMAYLVRLMMSVDAMRSAFRWWEHLEKQNTRVAHTDRQMSMLTMMGWAGETLRMIEEGADGGVVERGMLCGNDKLLQVWDEAFGTNSSAVVRKIHRARDKYFAHWDQDIARDFVEHQMSDGYDIPFIESDEGGKFRYNRFPWAYMAIWHDIVGPNIDEDELRKLVRRIAQIVASVSDIVNRVALAVSQRIGLIFEEIELEST